MKHKLDLICTLQRLILKIPSVFKNNQEKLGNKKKKKNEKQKF